MSAFMTIDRPQRVELGPSFIADIARNVCYLRTHQSQIGRGCVKTVASGLG